MPASFGSLCHDLALKIKNRQTSLLEILQISSAQSFGGGERYLADLANSLAVRGHQIHVAVRPNSPLMSKLKDVPKKRVYSLPLRNALDVHSANELAKVVKQQKIEIVHAHMARDYALAAFAVRRNPAARLILTRHVLFPLNRLHGRILRRAACVIAVSPAVARQLASQQLLPESRIRIVRAGVDVDRLQRARQLVSRVEFCRKWHLPEESVLIGSVGQLNPLKAHDVFLQAASIVLRQVPNVKFLIAGEDPSPKGETLTQLEKLIADLRLADHVRLLGRVDEIDSFLSALDVFVSASQTESFGLAMAEAMASSLPVVATSTDGALELLAAGDTGLLVSIGAPEDLAESVLKLAKDAKLREAMGQRAYLQARERLGLNRMVDEIEALYNESKASC